MIGWIIGGVVLLLLVWLIALYNRFVSLRNGIESTLNQITVALKKRLDMIGQTVDATKGVMKFEKSTLTELTALRSQAAGGITPANAGKVANAAARIAGAISVQVEAYPKLSSNENVKDLVAAVRDMEQEISQLRYTYNNLIQEFNTKREIFPSSIIANMFGFSKNNYLQMSESKETLDKRPDTSL